MTLPFENNTDAIIRKLADKSLQADKRRNIFIILTIAFAACLMVSLGLYTFGRSYETEQFYRGRYQAAVNHFEPDQIPVLSQDENIDKIGLQAGVTSLRNGRDTLNITYRDKANLNLHSIQLTNGHLPEKENEIAVPFSYLEKLGMEPAANQTLRLELGGHVSKEYTICGLTKDDDANNIYEILVSEPFLNTYYTGTEIPYQASLRMTGSEKMREEELKENIINCVTSYGFNETDIFFSSSYFSTNDSASRNTAGVLAVSVLIVIACITVIYSLFYISVTGKIREYGRMRVIGMTKKQVRRMVRKESRRLSLLSIPTGILAGCVIGYLLVPGGWSWPNTLRCVIMAAVLTEFAVLLSVRKPVKIASSVSPVEAVRITTTSDALRFNKTKKLHRKISPRSLAKITFSRNRKKAVLTLSSLSFTGILLMCAAAILLSADPVVLARQELGNHEMTISLNPLDDPMIPTVTAYDALQQKNPLDEKLIQELGDFPLIDDISAIKSCTANMFFPGNVNVEDMPFFELAGLSREYFKSHEELQELDYDEMTAKRGIIVDDSSGMIEKFGHYKFSKGDKIEAETDSGEKILLTVMASVSLDDKEYGGIYFFIPQDLLSVIKPKTENFNTSLFIHTDLKEISSTENYVYQKCGGNQTLRIQSISGVIAFMEEKLKTYQWGIYGLVLFIGIFALLNLINTLMTNLIFRQQELGILQSVGLTNRQLSQMLQTECLYYVAGTMSAVLTVGTAGGYILCQLFSQAGLLGKLEYTFPFLPILIFFAALVLIAAGYSVLAVRYCQRQSLAERIRAMD